MSEVPIHITKVATGETRIHHGDPCEYMWIDGNYSCDCNREIFFEQAGGAEFADIEHECTDGRFTAKYIKDDGTEVKLDP